MLVDGIVSGGRLKADNEAALANQLMPSLFHDQDDDHDDAHDGAHGDFLMTYTNKDKYKMLQRPTCIFLLGFQILIYCEMSVRTPSWYYQPQIGQGQENSRF